MVAMLTGVMLLAAAAVSLWCARNIELLVARFYKPGNLPPSVSFDDPLGRRREATLRWDPSLRIFLEDRFRPILLYLGFAFSTVGLLRLVDAHASWPRVSSVVEFGVVGLFLVAAFASALGLKHEYARPYGTHHCPVCSAPTVDVSGELEGRRSIRNFCQRCEVVWQGHFDDGGE